MRERLVVGTDELRAGDIVHCHGARVLLQGAPTTHPTQYGKGTVYCWPEMPIIAGAIATMEGLKSWTVQGNDLAHWEVTRGTDPLPVKCQWCRAWILREDDHASEL